MEEDLNEGEELGKPTKDLTYPSFLGRAGAYILDSLILAPVWILFYFLTRKLYTSESMLYPSAIITAIFSFLLIFYKIFFNTKFNGTPGKILCKYRICREDGMPVTWETSIKRESLYIVFQLFNFLVLYKFLFAHRAEIDTFWLLVSLFAKSAEVEFLLPVRNTKKTTMTTGIQLWKSTRRKLMQWNKKYKMNTSQGGNI